MQQSREPSDFAKHFSHQKKLAFLANLREDQFRDRVLRPVLQRMGLTHFRETCGPQEHGKDCIFLEKDIADRTAVWAFQTKRGRLTMSSSPSENLVSALAQLRTALNVDIVLPDYQGTTQPLHVVLASSGKVSEDASRYLKSQLKDPRLQIWDAEQLILLIDKHYPELWLGVDENRFPYLRSLTRHIESQSDAIHAFRTDSGQPTSVCSNDELYVKLYVYKIVTKRKKLRGQVTQEPDIVEQLFEQLLDERAPSLVLGEGGSGKTTAIRHLAYSIASQILTTGRKGPIPVVMSARDIAHSDVRLVEFAHTAASRLHGTEIAPFTDEDLQKNNVLLLIDAIDEVSKPEQHLVLSRIFEAYSDFPRLRIIATGRDSAGTARAWQSRGGRLYRMSSMSVRHARKIVEHISRGRSIAPELATETLRRLEDVHGLALNPLLITIFVATTDFTRQDIPPNITEIFKKYTELMLGRWDERKGLEQQYQGPLKDLLLRRLAYELHIAHRTETGVDECRQIFEQELTLKGYSADFDLLFDEIVFRSGLLTVDEHKVRFKHHLIQEFFAGRGIPSRELLSNFVTDTWWRTPIVFYFGNSPENYDELEWLINSRNYTDSVDMHEASITIGLAIQSCYLANAEDRTRGIKWVVRALASSMDSYIEDVASMAGPTKSLDLMAFIHCFIHARDAVGCGLVRKLKDGEREDGDELPNLTLVEKERFWVLLGLIECGQLSLVNEIIQDFEPSDRRLLLGLSMSAFLTERLRSASPEVRAEAAKLGAALEPKVAALTAQVLTEMKSVLLEVRKGEISALHPSTDPLLEDDGALNEQSE